MSGIWLDCRYLRQRGQLGASPAAVRVGIMCIATRAIVPNTPSEECCWDGMASQVRIRGQVSPGQNQVEDPCPIAINVEISQQVGNYEGYTQQTPLKPSKIQAITQQDHCGPSIRHRFWGFVCVCNMALLDHEMDELRVIFSLYRRHFVE